MKGLGYIKNFFKQHLTNKERENLGLKMIVMKLNKANFTELEFIMFPLVTMFSFPP